VTTLVDEKRVAVDAKGEGGYTALHVALVRKQVGVVAFLLDRGADINATTDDGNMPSSLACSGQELDRPLFGLLLAASKRTGTMLRYVTRKNTPLCEACKKADIAWATELLRDFRFDCT
jgi:ankyrin repeat protein